MTLAEIIAVLDAAYPPALAQSWDSVPPAPGWISR